MSADLLPCPFCGSPEIDEDGWTSTESHGPGCGVCGGSCGSALRTPAENIEAWNRRVTPAAGAAEVALRQWIADLQSGLYVNCVYCGHRYGPGESTPATMADALKLHIATCPEHPMSRLRSALDGAYHALRSYETGNASPELAKALADHCELVLGETSTPTPNGDRR